MVFPIPTDKIETRHYINGTFSESSDGGTFELTSPYSHEKIVDMYEASEEDTNRAVAAAKAAFPAWSNADPGTRGTYMKKLAELIKQSSNELMQLDAMAMGRPVSQHFDAEYTATLFEHYAMMGYEAQGTTSLNTPGFVNMTMRQPIGPVAAIIPWNIPTLMFGMKLAPALAAGCTVVLKSSEKAPLTVGLHQQRYGIVNFALLTASSAREARRIGARGRLPTWSHQCARRPRHPVRNNAVIAYGHPLDQLHRQHIHRP